MALHSRSSFEYGFTYMELVIACGLLGLLGSLLVPIAMNSFYAYAVMSERETLLTLLTTARSKAMANIQGKSSGIALDSEAFILFSGNEYDEYNPANEATPALGTVEKTSTTSIITFTALSGESTPSKVTLTAGGRASTITINASGTIE